MFKRVPFRGSTPRLLTAVGRDLNHQGLELEVVKPAAHSRGGKDAFSLEGWLYFGKALLAEDGLLFFLLSLFLDTDLEPWNLGYPQWPAL